MPTTPSTAFSKNLAFRAPISDPAADLQEVSAVAVGDILRMLAEGIADAQAALDRASAAMITELATSKVTVIPRITETVAADGSVVYTQAPGQEISLLDLGITPTFYAFAEATVEVAMDMKLVENVTESGTSTTGKKYALYGDTSSLRFERKLNRDISVSSKITAKLVPVPKPLRLDPVRNTTTPT